MSIHSFLEYISLEKNSSVHTQTAYQGDLEDFKGFLLKQDFPNLKFIANGGLSTVNECLDLLSSKVKIGNKKPVDGVMIGRETIQNPWILVHLEKALFFDNTGLPKSPDRLIEHLQKYFETQVKRGFNPYQITKNWLYLFKNYPGSKIWRSSLASGLCPLEAYKKANLELSFGC